MEKQITIMNNNKQRTVKSKQKDKNIEDQKTNNKSTKNYRKN